MTALEGALIEPLAVGFHAANQGGAGPGQVCVVTGAGCIGLVSMMAAKARGVSRVYVVDVIERRLEKALEMGADGVVNGRNADTVEEILRLTEGKGADLVIETAGSEITTRQAIEFSKKGAMIVLVGYSATGEETLPIGMCLDKELTFKTVFRYRHIYPMAIDAAAAGRVDLKHLCTHIFDFDELPEAMERCVTDKAGIVKAAIRFSND